MTIQALLIRWMAGPRVEMVKALDCGIVVCEFDLDSPYYAHFQTHTIRKMINFLIVPATT